MATTVLFFGDVVGRPGRETVRDALPGLKEKHRADFVVANVENIAGGSGITGGTVRKMFAYGVDVCTTGDHIFRNKDFVQIIDEPRVLRPANLPVTAAGRGWSAYTTVDGVRLAVVNLQGRIFMEPHRCPFEIADAVLAEISALDPLPHAVLVDIHAEATSEKVALGRHLDGRVAAVVGTHTHVQTADEHIMPGGTAYITDLGMCGPYDSIIGRDTRAVLQRLRTGMPARFVVAKRGLRACGVALCLDEQTGRAVAVERFQVPTASKEPTEEQKEQNGRRQKNNAGAVNR